MKKTNLREKYEDFYVTDIKYINEFYAECFVDILLPWVSELPYLDRYAENCIRGMVSTHFDSFWSKEYYSDYYPYVMTDGKNVYNFEDATFDCKMDSNLERIYGDEEIIQNIVEKTLIEEYNKMHDIKEN